jgi:hypothetical protein
MLRREMNLLRFPGEEAAREAGRAEQPIAVNAEAECPAQPLEAGDYERAAEVLGVLKRHGDGSREYRGA